MTHAIDPKDFHLLIRLALGAAERGGNPAARRWLIEQLCKHTSAAAGTLALAGDDESPEVATVIRLARQQRATIVHPTTRIVHGTVCSALPVDGKGISVLWLRQPKRHWTGREVTLLDLLHPEVAWLHHPTNHRETALSPRQSETLRLLLRGQSEKQIAGELKLSVHTVHVYVKAIYKAHHVSSRAELLAKWVKE